MSVCCECCVLSARGLCDKLITHPEESCRMWCVVVCDLDLLNVETLAHWGLSRQKQTNKQKDIPLKPPCLSIPRALRRCIHLRAIEEG